MRICGIMIFMEIPITQSKEWHKLQEDLGEKSFFISEKTYQYLAILKSTPVGNYLYCPYGPIAENQTTFKNSLRSLEELAKKHKAIFVRIEPFEADYAKSLPSSTQKSHDLNPKETWLLDLTGSDADFKDRLPSRLLRYHKSAAKKGITIKKSHNPADIRYLLDLQKALARQKGINTFSEDYLKTELSQPFATLYLVLHRQETPPKGVPRESRAGEEAVAGPVEEEDNVWPDPPKEQVVAAGLVFDDKTTRYNLQGAQSEEGRKLHATGILTIQLIKDAKAKGLKKFDFWGIAPEGASPDHPWAGFTNFKKTFAGYQFNHAGTYDIILNRPKYRLYKVMRKLNRARK